VLAQSGVVLSSAKFTPEPSRLYDRVAQQPTAVSDQSRSLRMLSIVEPFELTFL